jgi:protein involved in polysaccharide export with SLBB domain
MPPLKMPTMSRVLSVVWALLALVSLTAVAQAEEPPLRPSSANVEDSYQLGTGDKVRVIVFGEEDLSGEFQIDGNGRISLPLIGEVQASGQTGAGLEQDIAGRLADGYLQNPRVSVEITVYRPFYVIGEINKPGEYAYVNGMSALNAIALAGGFTQKADEDVLYIRRNGSTREEKVPADQMTRILPGDVVRVPITFFWSAMSVVSPLAAPAALAYSIIP